MLLTTGGARTSERRRALRLPTCFSNLDCHFGSAISPAAARPIEPPLHYKGHNLYYLGGIIVFCWLCGRHSEGKFRKLADDCPIQADKAVNPAHRMRLNRMWAGQHPKSRHHVGVPVPLTLDRWRELAPACSLPAVAPEARDTLVPLLHFWSRPWRLRR